MGSRHRGFLRKPLAIETDEALILMAKNSYVEVRTEEDDQHDVSQADIEELVELAKELDE